MSRVWLAASLVFLLFSTTAFAFSFAVFGDNQGNYQIFNDLLSRIKAEKGLNLLISVGDNVDYGAETDYQKFYQLIGQLGIPFYQALGNHDGVNGGWRNYLKRAGSFYRSFDYQDSHFIILNNAFRESFDQEQFNWLKNDLASSRAKFKFVFMHKPVFDPSEIYQNYVMSGRAVTEELEKLFERYKVNYVFAGHIHGFARAERNGVTYIVTGGGGGQLVLPPEFGGFYHFIRVDVNGDKLQDRVIRIYE